MVEETVKDKSSSGVRITYGNTGAIVSFVTGGVPLHLWKDWDSDCRERYGGQRFLKMWSDHCITKKLELDASLSEAVSVMKMKEKEEANTEEGNSLGLLNPEGE